MNGNYYQNPTFPNNSIPINEEIIANQNNIPLNEITKEYSLEGLLKINKGKRINVFMSFPNSKEDNKSFPGIIEESEKDYLILSNPETGKWYMLKHLYIDYIEFMEKLAII